MARLYDNSFVYDNSSLQYDGVYVHAVTASGNGSGTATATGLHIVPRSANNTGLGTQTTVHKSIIIRTSLFIPYDSAGTLYDSVYTYNENGATGIGSSSTTIKSKIRRVASNVASSSSNATGLHILPRTVNNSGSSTETASFLHICPRTAESAGVSTEFVVAARVAFRDAESSGDSVQTANWNKLFIFRTPVEDRFPWDDYRSSTAEHRLFGKANQGYRARNIFRLKTGAYTNVDPLDPTLVERVYYGGHEHFVTQTEKDDLVSAGYTVT